MLFVEEIFIRNPAMDHKTLKSPNITVLLFMYTFFSLQVYVFGVRLYCILFTSACLVNSPSIDYLTVLPHWWVTQSLSEIKFPRRCAAV